MGRRRQRYQDDYDDEPPDQRGAFASGFGFSSGCLMGALMVFVGLPLLACGGCAMLGLIGSARVPKQDVANTPDMPTNPIGNGGRAPVDKPVEPKAKPEVRKWPYQFVATKTERDGLRDVMDLYSFSGKFDMMELEAFCRERKERSPAKAFYYVVIFDDPTNAVFPNNPFTATFNEEREAKHVRAIYCYNRLNGFSELDVYELNSWESRPTTIKP